MSALLADHVLTGVLAAGDTSTGALPPGAQFAVSQRFLAETAMIAAEAPDLGRSIVVAPPQDWSPSAALASQLLERDQQHAVAGAHRAGQPGPGGGQRAWLSRRPLPASKDSPGELSGSYLSRSARSDASSAPTRTCCTGLRLLRGPVERR